MPQRTLRLVLLLTLSIAGTARAQRVTIEGLRSAPFPSEIEAAPAGGHVAWVQNDRGSRNVWIASAPDFEARRVTAFSGDDGQEIANLMWSPDGKTVLFVRGGEPNRQDEIPNPASLADKAEQAIWAVGVDGGDARKLAPGSAPEVSVAGQVAYLVKGQIWATDLAAAEPSQLISIRGRARELEFAPDGKRLAFVSSRGDHSFVGVFELASRELRYLDPSVDLDANVSWSPDGSRIAFTRTPNVRDKLLFTPQREGEPWSIRVVDTASGRGMQVWAAARGAGSVFQGIIADDQVMWAAGDRLVFPWERDGWIHLYAVAVRGGDAVLLTPGAFEVEHVALAPGRDHVIYSSNQDDLDRRHLWSVAVAGGAPAALTKGDGSEWMPAPLSDDVVAFIGAGGKMAAHPAILRHDADDRTGRSRGGAQGSATALVPVPKEFPAAQLVEPQPVIFPAADGMAIHGQLFLPRDIAPGERRPAVLFFHGGSRRQMLLSWHYLGYYHDTYAINQYLASRGYVVMSVNYRSGTGYGLDFREAPNYGATGASEFNDVLGAGLYLKTRADVDPERIGVYGGSYGGYLTAHALARASHLFAAGVDIHGVHDWNAGIRNFFPDYDPGPEIERRNFEASPLAFVSGWRSPVLLIHGDDDRNVSFSETVTLVEALRKQGVTFEQLILPDEIHGFLRDETWVKVFGAVADFLDRYLKAKKTASS
jgi:dipeptidyl aminopeptidase/acylaminoacyl peptidase